MKCADNGENFTVQLSDPQLYDQLHMLSAEYSLSMEFLINAAVEKMIRDVEFVRMLRQHHP